MKKNKKFFKKVLTNTYFSVIIITEGNINPKKQPQGKEEDVKMLKNQIVRLLDESNRQKQHSKEVYEHCTNKDDRQILRNAYLKALDVYAARYQMLLCFGYDVVADENGNIIGIEEI